MADLVVTKQELIDAQKDAQALDDIVNKGPEVHVKTRLGRYVWTLATLEQRSLLQINEWQNAITLITANDGVPALAVVDASGKTQQEINNSFAFFITPEMYGATGKNLEKDQTAFNSMIALGSSQTWQLKSGREYHVTNVTPPSNTIIYANWAKLKKASNDSQNVLNLYNDNTKVYNIEIDGNKSGTTMTGFGIRSLGNFNNIHGFYVHDAGRYGVVLANCENSTIKNGRSNNNGVWAVDGSTQADGIYFSNTKYCTAENCQTTGNGRTGLVQTSYFDGHIQPDLCHKNTFKNCQSSGNAYSDVNTEGVSNPILHNLTLAGGISFSRTNDADVADVSCSVLYATEVTTPSVKRVTIKHAGIRATTDNFYLNGANLTVDTVTIDNTNAPTLSGISFQVVDSGTSNIDNVKINRAANAVNIQSTVVESILNINVVTATGYKYRLNNQTFADLPVYESKRRLTTSADEAVTLTGTAGGTIDVNTFENGTFYSVDTGGAGTYLNFPTKFGNQYLTIETKVQSGVRSYQVARSLFVNTVMYRVKTAASTWSAWVFITQRTATLSYNPPSLAPAEVAFVDVAFVGVALGDCTTSSFSLPLQGVRQWAEVAEAGKVKVYFKNETATAIDLASGTITVKLI